MKCDNQDCPYCVPRFQKLEIFFRVRLPWRIHAELRARHNNVSAYIRNLILEDLHKKPESAFKPSPRSGFPYLVENVSERKTQDQNTNQDLYEFNPKYSV